MIKAKNFNKILKLVSALLIKISQVENENKVSEFLYDCCLRGIKIINIINIIYNLNGTNINSDGFNENCIQELKEKNIYDLGYHDLSMFLQDEFYQDELNNISYSDIVNN